MKERAREGMRMIVVMHEMGFAREVADRVLMIEGGQTEDGTPSTSSPTRSTSGRRACSRRSCRGRA